ncbi:MAG: hypothetical protein Q9210_003006 [Variospora velana]
MTPGFGFSAGDIVSAIGLIRKVQKALKDTGGASTEYQHVILELQGLENVFRQLEALEPNEDNVSQINAIRGMALACQIPLRNFLAKVEQYDTSMSPFATRFSFKSAGHKANWALFIAEDVTKLRALVAAKALSINLWFAMHVSKTVSRIDSKLEADNAEVTEKMNEQHGQLSRVEIELQALDRRLDQEYKATDKRLDHIEEATDQSKLAVFSLRTLSSQIATFISSFPREARVYMRRTLQDNFNMYQVLLQIQNCIAARPASSLDSDIRFEDALGRTRNLPYEHFRDWEKNTNNDRIPVPTPIKAASKEAETARRRRATASHRFRERREQKKREPRDNIVRLEQQVFETEKKRDYYREERNHFRSLVCEDASQAHLVTSRPPSPRHLEFSNACQSSLNCPQPKSLNGIESASARVSSPEIDESGRHICVNCTRSLARPEQLRRDERSPTEENPFECSECPLCFARTNLLPRHQREFHQTRMPKSREKAGKRSALPFAKKASPKRDAVTDSGRALPEAVGLPLSALDLRVETASYKDFHDMTRPSKRHTYQPKDPSAPHTKPTLCAQASPNLRRA